MLLSFWYNYEKLIVILYVWIKISINWTWTWTCTQLPLVVNHCRGGGGDSDTFFYRTSKKFPTNYHNGVGVLSSWPWLTAELTSKKKKKKKNENHRGGGICPPAPPPPPREWYKEKARIKYRRGVQVVFGTAYPVCDEQWSHHGNRIMHMNFTCLVIR